MTSPRVDYILLPYGFAFLLGDAAVGMFFDDVVSEYHHIGRVRNCTSNSLGNCLTTQTVITIHEGHECSRSRIQSGITGRGHSSAWLMSHANPLIGLCHGVAEFRRPVRGPIVDQYDLKVRVGLRAQTVHTIIEVMFRVPYRHDDAYKRR